MPNPPARVLVTGSTGFVGRHLLPILQTALPEAAIIPARMQLTEPDAVLAEVAAVQPDACIHLAAISAVAQARSDMDAAWRVNLHGTLSLAQALIRAAPGCTLVYASTADAYGRSFASGLPLDEAAALAPVNIYGATKAAADLALGVMAQEGLHVIRMRPFNHTGPGQTANFVVSAFARQVARVAAGLQQPVLQVGALEPRRDFLDVRDVCRAYAGCLLQRDTLPSGTIINLASGTSRRVGDVLAELMEIAGVQATIQTDAARLRPSDIPLASGDASAAHRVLGWRPQIPWRTTLTDLLADWRVRAAAEAA